MTQSVSDEVYWCPRIWYWPYYGFCPSEKAWYAEMKNSEKWRVTDGHAAIPAYPDPKEANVTRLRLVETGDGEPVDKLVQLVTIAPHLDRLPIDTVMGIIVHEAMHVFQHMCEEIEEDRPSSEFAAYTLQSMAQQLFKGYLLTRRPDEFTLTSESNGDDTKDTPLTETGTAGVGSLHKARRDPEPLSLPVAAGRTAAGPSRRRKASRRLPPPR